MLAIRAGFVLYLSILSVLLLIPHPEMVIGGRELPGFFREYLTHFLLFTGLTLLALAARWPVRAGAMLALLAAYAVAMEGLQAFSPPRVVSLGDLIENLLGIAAGTAIWWWLAKRRR
jgi:VanZ family protein